MPSQDLELGQLPGRTAARRTAASSGSEPPKPPRAEGFIAVAAKIAEDPDKSTTIYRRFDALSARNLLSYQSELAELEDLQNQYDKEDLKAKDPSSIECQHDWEVFADQAKGSGRAREKMELAMKIRTTLEKYRK